VHPFFIHFFFDFAKVKNEMQKESKISIIKHHKNVKCLLFFLFEFFCLLKSQVKLQIAVVVLRNAFT